MENNAKTLQGPMWKRMVFAAGRTTLTIGAICAAVAMGVAGHSALSARASAAVAPEAAPRTTVAAERLRMMSSVTLPRRFTGQIEATQAASLGFEEGGTIREVLVREGDAVAKGDVLARLDTRLLDAERNRLVASRTALSAQAELARRTNDRQVALLSEGHVTQQRIDETSLQLARLDALMAEIDAALQVVDVRLAKAVVTAPFAGRIGQRLLDNGAIAGPGTGVVTLVEVAQPRFRVALDPELAVRLSRGDTVEINVSGLVLSAQLSELSPELDPSTRSRIAFFDIVSEVATLPSGATGEVMLNDTVAASGAWVPLSALQQGPRGSWTLLTVAGDTASDATITMEAAEIIHLDAGRAFIRGSFTDGTLYLPGGTHRVVPGEAVRISETS